MSGGRLIAAVWGAALALAAPGLGVVPVGATSCATPIAAGPYGPTIWCQAPLVTAPISAHTGADFWVDDFGYTGPYAHLPSDYLSFESQGPNPPLTEHFYGGPGGHWHTDIDGNGQELGGTVMRPDRSFTFDPGGRFVVDTEVAPGLDAYTPAGGSMAWTELIVTTCPRPTTPNTGLYARDWFGGCWTWSLEFWGGSFADGSHAAITAQYIDSCNYSQGCPGSGDSGTEQNYICKEDNFEKPCGSGQQGWFGTLDGLYPRCGVAANIEDCYVRIRLILTKGGGANGSSSVEVDLAKPGSDSFQRYGYDDGFTLNPMLTDGQLYVYQGDYQYLAPGPVRYHWDYLAVNPQLAGAAASTAAPKASAGVSPAATPTQAAKQPPAVSPSPASSLAPARDRRRQHLTAAALRPPPAWGIVVLVVVVLLGAGAAVALIRRRIRGSSSR
jgi:hypothetical protein